MVVLPVPGPPATTETRAATAAAAASACRPATSSPKSRRTPSPSSASSTVGGWTTGERDQVVGDLTLLAEVAVEVQARPVEAQRPAARRPRLADFPRHPPSSHPGPARAARRCRLVRPCRPSPCRGWSPGRRTRGPGGAHVRPARRRARPVRRRARRKRGESPRDMNVGGGEHARVVERGEQPGGGTRAADVEGIRVGHAGTAPRSRTSLSAPTSAAGGLPGEHAAGVAVHHRRVRPDHAAHEEVEDAGEVPVGVVVRQSPAQVAVQRDGVEQRLQARSASPASRRRVRPAGSARRSAARRARRGGWSCSRRSRSGRSGRRRTSVDAARQVAAQVALQPSSRSRSA